MKAHRNEIIFRIVTSIAFCLYVALIILSVIFSSGILFFLSVTVIFGYILYCLFSGNVEGSGI